MSNRKYNFCPGPCTLPLEVLEETKSELVDYHGSGMSLIETSHRSDTFADVHSQAIALARELISIPDDFAVCFIQGGATLQFAMTAMNLLNSSNKGGYVNSGHWAKLAIDDASVYGEVYKAWDGTDANYAKLPGNDDIEIQPGTRYLHITTNETIGGVQFPEFPNVDVPLIADMSSDYFSRMVPWDRVDIVYGGVQKNLGPSGMAMVIIRKSIADEISKKLPTYLDYRVHISGNSLYNTPPVFSIYVTGKVLKWLKANGGVEKMAEVATEKSQVLYRALDSSDGFYSSPVDVSYRSKMNVVFLLPNQELESKFLVEAQQEGLENLAGHRSVGGIRASIYNAMPFEGVETLVSFMDEFRAANT